MRTVLVPTDLSDEIYRKIDAAIAEVPESDRVAVTKERWRWYQILLRYFDEHGVVPEFTLTNIGERPSGSASDAPVKP